MSDPIPSLPESAGPLRALAVRLSDDLRTRLDVIAHLNQRTVTEEIRVALEDWVERMSSDPKVMARADSVRAEIEAEAEARRTAISAIFDHGPQGKTRAPKRAGSSPE